MTCGAAGSAYGLIYESLGDNVYRIDAHTWDKTTHKHVLAEVYIAYTASLGGLCIARPPSREQETPGRPQTDCLKSHVLAGVLEHH